MVAPGAMSIADALACQHQLESVSDTAGLDVSLLLCHVLDRPRSYLYTWPERLLEPAQQAQFCALLQRLDVRARLCGAQAVGGEQLAVDLKVGDVEFRQAALPGA